MSVPLLQTKLYIPQPPREHVSRPRLFEQLDAGIISGHRLILISAPAGFGKTTIISEWISQRDLQTAWISLDEAENESLRFLTYFIAALQQFDPALGEDILNILQSPQPPPMENIMTVLLNQVAILSGQFLVVLDDYHLITNPAVHQVLIFFVENLPPQIHLALLSRADPPMPLARLRARGQMTELRAADLRFTADEIISFLNHVIQLKLSDAQIQIMESRTEGWIAGLQMAALSLKGKSDTEAFIAAFSGSHRFILDYLTEEVLRGQSDELQQFILKTSILNRLNGPLCEAITGMDNGRETLEKLEDANLFLIPLDDERIWYRYHHLFADVMANRLQRNFPDQIFELHLRAARWFQQNNLPAEAIEHALSGNNYQFAAEMVENQAMDLLMVGSLATLSGWLSKFSPDLVSARPELGVISAWVHMLMGKAENIEGFLAIAEENFHNLDSSNNPDHLRGQIAAIRTYLLAQTNHLDDAVAQANLALQLLPKDDFSVRCVVVFVLGGIHYMQQDIPRALATMKTASQLGVQAGNIHVAVSALSSVGDILLHQGNLAESEKVLYQALQLGTGRRGQPLPITAGVHSGMAELRLMQKDLTSARQFAQTGLDLGEKWSNPDSQLGCYLVLAQIENLEGNPDEAQATFEKAKYLAATHHLAPGQEEQIRAYEAVIYGTATQGIDQSMLPEPLTERELEVLQLLAAGMSNRAIADELVIALGTTKTHISRIMGKLNAENRTHAVNLARELGLISE